MATLERTYLRPITSSWLGVVEECRKARQDWLNLAETCELFYSGKPDFMWSDDFQAKYWGGALNSKFHVQINKAFEMVAIMCPYLYWQYPWLKMHTEDPVKIPEELLDPSNPLFAMFSQFDSEQKIDIGTTKLRNSLWETYLNYSQREQPGGGRKKHSRLAITDAMVLGRGCLWVESYTPPGSNRVLTQAIHDSPKNLLIDPDCTDPSLLSARFVIRRHVEHTWEVERRFDLPRGTVRGTMISKTGAGMKRESLSNSPTPAEKASMFDLVEWFEIFSKMGAGSRLSEANGVDELLDEIVGDYAYICVSPGCPDYPLNAHVDKMNKAPSDKDIESMFEWPVPFWIDSKWPVAVLDLYNQTMKCWPIPPMAPALGELIALNILFSCYLEGTYENTKQVCAILESAVDDVTSALNSSQNPAVIKIKENTYKSINDVVQFMQKPNYSANSLDAISLVSQTFDRRAGTSELLYGGNAGGTQSRSAYDTKTKENMATIRPQDMANRVAEWQEVCTDMERLCARLKVTAKDLVPLLGKVGSYLWDKYIDSEDPELTVRGMRTRIDIKDMTKPNNEYALGNMQNLAQFLIPVLQLAAQAGDVEPINGFLKSYGDALDLDVTPWLLSKPPNPPGPPTEGAPPPDAGSAMGSYPDVGLPPMSQEGQLPPELMAMMPPGMRSSIPPIMV